jgi:hypothetical protein
MKPGGERKMSIDEAQGVDNAETSNLARLSAAAKIVRIQLHLSFASRFDRPLTNGEYDETERFTSI